MISSDNASDHKAYAGIMLVINSKCVVEMSPSNPNQAGTIRWSSHYCCAGGRQAHVYALA